MLYKAHFPGVYCCNVGKKEAAREGLLSGKRSKVQSHFFYK